MNKWSAAATGAMIFWASSWASCAAEQGWSIAQQAKGSALGASTVIYVTPTGMRTSDAKTGLSFFTKGPQWNMVMYNTQTKNIYQTSLKTWMQSLAQRRMSSKFEGATWKRGGQTTIAGIRAYEFVVDKLPAAKTIRTAGGKSKAVPPITGAKLYVAQDIATPPEVSGLIAKLYGVPDCQRIPVRLVVSEAGKPPSVAMDTVKVQRINVPDSMFVAPKGYKPVKSDMEVFVDKESMDAIDDMLKDL